MKPAAPVTRTVRTASPTGTFWERFSVTQPSLNRTDLQGLRLRLLSGHDKLVSKPCTLLCTGASEPGILCREAAGQPAAYLYPSQDKGRRFDEHDAKN